MSRRSSGGDGVIGGGGIGRGGGGKSIVARHSTAAGSVYDRVAVAGVWANGAWQRLIEID